MNRKSIYLFPVILTVLFSLGSCSSRQDIYISNSGSGYIAVDVTLSEMVTRYAGDILGGFSGSNQDEFRLFDMEKIAATITSLNSITLTKVSSVSKENLHLEFNFEDPGEIITNYKSTDISPPVSFSVKSKNGVLHKYLDIYISVENWGSVTSLLGMEDSEIIATFGPQDIPYTREEYLDLMEFLFEEYESPSYIRNIIESSKVGIFLKIDGVVTSVSGCTITDNGIEVEIPLLDLVTLEEPITIKVEWE